MPSWNLSGIVGTQIVSCRYATMGVPTISYIFLKRFKNWILTCIFKTIRISNVHKQKYCIVLRVMLLLYVIIVIVQATVNNKYDRQHFDNTARHHRSTNIQTNSNTNIHQTFDLSFSVQNHNDMVFPLIVSLSKALRCENLSAIKTHRIGRFLVGTKGLSDTFSCGCKTYPV